MLVVMTGLPGTGKTTLARAIGAALPAPVLSVDSVERAIRRAGVGAGEPVGLAAYAVAQALADEELAAQQRPWDGELALDTCAGHEDNVRRALARIRDER